MKHKRIILVGKAASGKDHMRKTLESKGFKYSISYTTRPPRSSEENGKDYFFISEEVFKGMIERDEFYEHVAFNNWYYGTTKDQFYSNDVFIMTPYGISCIDSEDRKESFIIYFDIDESIRKERLSKRSDADSVERRLKADEIDFRNFTEYDIIIKNDDF
jgi:guanylate kinase